MQPLGKCSTEGLVGVGIGAAELMIHVNQPGDFNVQVAGQLVEEPGQRHRIGAAGQRDGQAVPRCGQSVPFDGANDATREWVTHEECVNR